MALQQALRSIPARPLSLNRGTGRISQHGLGFLNGAQFLGALNDNLFKFLNIFLLIDYYGAAASTEVLSWVGLSYVAPFLLFSSMAGILADRFSKQKLIVILKVAEIVIIGASYFVFSAKSPIGCYLLVFLLSSHSAVMGPPKYSIIPELVKKEKISKANGFVTSFTYLAIIIGTFLASFLTQVSGRNFLFCVTFCMIAAIIGLVCALYIPHTEPRKNKKKIRVNFVSQTYQTLKLCRRTPLLLLTVVGSAFFLFVGAFLQLNIIPFAIENLGLSEIGGGYLFLGSSIGIAAGAAIAGKLSKKGIELGLACFASFMLSLFLFCLPMMNTPLGAAVTLALLGFSGGLYVIPQEAYIQTISASDTRGQIVAAANFLSFVGVLLAPICLFIFGKVLHVSASFGFAVIGLVIFCTSFCMMLRLGGIFCHYFSKKCLQPFFEMHLVGSPLQFKEMRVALLSTTLSWKQVALLLGENPAMHLFIVKDMPSARDAWISRFANIDFLYYRKNSEQEMLKLVQRQAIGAVQPFFVFTSQTALVHFYQSAYFNLLKDELDFQFRYVSIKHKSHFKPSFGKFLKRTQITYLFENKNPALTPSS